MSWIVYSLCFLLILYFIRRTYYFRLPGLPSWSSYFFFGVKILSGIAMWWIYTYHYPDRKAADVWKYFDDGKIMQSAMHERPAAFFRMVSGIGAEDPSLHYYYSQMDHWYQQFDNQLLNDGHLLIRINAVLHVFSWGNFHTHSLIFCFLSFIGLCALYRCFYPYMKEWKYTLAIILFLFPSLLFWSSSVLKEGIVIFALGLLIYNFTRMMSDRRPKRFIFFTLAAFLLLLSKFYLLFALVPVMIAFTWMNFFPGRAFLKYLVTVIVFLIGTWSLHFVSARLDVLKILAWKQKDFVNLGLGGTRLYNDSIVVSISSESKDPIEHVRDSLYTIRKGTDYMYWYHHPDFSDTFFVKNSHDPAIYKLFNRQPRSGSLLTTSFLQPECSSFIRATPAAFEYSLLRPWPWEAKNLLLLLPAMENIVFIMVLLCAVIFFRRPQTSSLVLFLIFYSGFLLWLIGITTPVLGALVRYRAMALPFLIIALLMFVDKERLLRVIGRAATRRGK